MKILNNIHIPKTVRAMAIATPLLLMSPVLKAQQNGLQTDVFEKSNSTTTFETPDSMMLSPEIKVANEIIYPAIVVDLSENKLYHYDYDGYLYDVYPVASGKESTPTKPALKIITGIEEYPYKKAPKSTKRYKNPNDYGTHLLNLSDVDPATGKITGSNGQFIHGTFKPSSIGKKVSKGCVRVHNDVIDMLAGYVEKGQYVLIKE